MIQLRLSRLLFVGLLMVGLAGCQLLGDLPSSGDNPQPTDTIVVTGTVMYMDLEGGFWAIIGDDGQNYDPINLSTAFQEEGLRVRARGTIRDDLASVHQFGLILDIETIERL